jgi:ribosomal-protein-alanine N-acetyltransferase
LTDAAKEKEIFIRRMEEEDVPAVAAIERNSFSLPWSDTSFLNEIRKEHGISRVAVVGDTVVGYVSAESVLDEGHILNLGVHPEYKKRGIATALVENILEELKVRACRFLYLEVRASNFVAKRLYQGFGFSVVGRRKNYYVAPNEDAVIMMLEV